MDCILLMGAPGAGKNTQGESLVRSLGNARFLSTGVLLRDAVLAGGMLGDQISQFLQMGLVVPTNLLIPVLENGIALVASQYLVLDFAGTGEQCPILDEILDRHGYRVKLVLLLTVPRAELISRLIKRGRSDDQVDLIAKRLEIYEREIPGVLDYYRARRILSEVDGSGDPEHVTQRLLDALNGPTPEPDTNVSD